MIRVGIVYLFSFFSSPPVWVFMSEVHFFYMVFRPFYPGPLSLPFSWFVRPSTSHAIIGVAFKTRFAHLFSVFPSHSHVLPPFVFAFFGSIGFLFFVIPFYYFSGFMYNPLFRYFEAALRFAAQSSLRRSLR